MTYTTTIENTRTLSEKIGSSSRLCKTATDLKQPNKKRKKLTTSQYDARNKEVIDRFVGGDDSALIEFMELNKSLINRYIYEALAVNKNQDKDTLYQEAATALLIARKMFDPLKLNGSKPASFFMLHLSGRIRNMTRKSLTRASRETSDIDDFPIGVHYTHTDTGIRKILKIFMKEATREDKIIVKYRWFRDKESYTRIGSRIDKSREYVRKRCLLLAHKMKQLLDGNSHH